MNPNDFIMVYIPYPSKDKALESAKILIEKKLIACANIFDSITSVYRWENKIIEDQEVILIGKTQKIHFDLLRDEVQKIHPYETPCILSYPLHQGNPKYLKWIKEETT